MWKGRIEKNPAELERYCVEVLKLHNPEIKIRKILYKSLIRENGYYMYISSNEEGRLCMMNAVSLCLKQDWINYIHKLEKLNFENISREKNIKLYQILCDKHKNTIYINRPNSLGKLFDECKENFFDLTLNDQVTVLLEMLKTTQISLATANFSILNKGKNIGKMRMNKKISNEKDILLINQSVTGLYEQKVNLLTV